MLINFGIYKYYYRGDEARPGDALIALAVNAA